ncbi:hypothetical protein LJY25_03435 [Hymenobacter sp. BT175]|uniref:hypothetical protein n=1 Tax=Hymenobacter translucens TaxID=2886507 RepID=UPI001D0EE1A4|nr:hypothetical protein [Hymenobacter translucens]MCC2545483.1 hypothetical protein [Hymenobacter translucens]
MNLSLPQSLLENLTCFSHLAAVRTPLQLLASFTSATTIQPSLRLPAAAAVPWQPAFEPAPGPVGLPAAQQALLARACFFLRPYDIEIAFEDSLPFGLRLALHRGTEQGTVVVYHKTTGAWSKAVGEGAPSALSGEAARVLNQPLPQRACDVVGVWPATAPLLLASLYCQLEHGTQERGWTLAWLELGASALEVWVQDPAGALAHLTVTYGPADAPLQLQQARFQTPELREQLLALLCEVSHATE